MAREFQRSLEQAANEAGMSEMQKSLRSLDQSLNCRHRQRPQVRPPADAHRRRRGGDEAGRRRRRLRPTPCRRPRRREAAPAGPPAEGEERAAGR